jgi:hypothetical protein
MTFQDLKMEIEKLNLSKKLQNFSGFEESFEFEHFKTFFAMIDEPKYTLMQCKNSEEFNTSEDTWFLCIPQDNQMCVIDAGTEEEVCEQYFRLMEILSHGFGTIKIEKKD